MLWWPYLHDHINTNPILVSLRLPPSWVERMHYSVGSTRQGHALVSRVGQYTDLVGCVLVPVPVGWGAPWLASLSLRGPSQQALKGPFFFFRRVFEAFLELLGMSGLWPCTQTHLKKWPCATLVWLVGQTTNTDFLLVVKPVRSDGHFYLLYYHLFCMYVLFIQYTCSIYFFFFCVFFLAPNRPQQYNIGVWAGK